MKSPDNTYICSILREVLFYYMSFAVMSENGKSNVFCKKSAAQLNIFSLCSTF